MEQKCPSINPLTFWRLKWKFILLICKCAFLLCLYSRVGSFQAQAGDVYITSTNAVGGFGLAGSNFVPRGVNYDVTGTPNGYHGLFDPCVNGRTYPSCYGDGSQAEANLRYIHGSQSGAVFSYNYVRIFLNSEYVNNGFTFTPGADLAATGTISEAWLSNLADFLQRAKNNGLRVILAGEYAPANFTYAGLTCSDPAAWPRLRRAPAARTTSSLTRTTRPPSVAFTQHWSATSTAPRSSKPGLAPRPPSWRST